MTFMAVITTKGDTNNKVGVLPNITMYMWPSCICYIKFKKSL